MEKLHYALWQRCCTFVRNACSGRDASHGLAHMQKVTEGAVLLCLMEKGPALSPPPAGALLLYRVILVGMLHDVADHKYDDAQGTLRARVAAFVQEESRQLLASFPETAASAAEVEQYVMTSLDAISYSKENTRGMRWFEEKLPQGWLAARDYVSDADKLEAIGEEGLLRCYEFSCERLRDKAEAARVAGAAPRDGIADPLASLQAHLLRGVAEHFDEKLKRLLPEFIVTPAGKFLGEPRHAAMEELLARWLDGSSPVPPPTLYWRSAATDAVYIEIIGSLFLPPMDVAAFVQERREDLEAFTATLFSTKKDGAARVHKALYRRPSSDNVPLAFLPRQSQPNPADGLDSLGPRATRASAEARRRSRESLVRKRKERLRASLRPTARRRQLRRRRELSTGVKVCHPGQSANPVATTLRAAWMPSHKYAVKHLRRKQLLVFAPPPTAGAGSDEHTANAYPHLLSVATANQRKCHRSLQRWVSQVSSAARGGRPPALPPARSPPVSFLVDLSHYCVYMLEAVNQGETVTLPQAADFLGVAELVPSLANASECLVEHYRGGKKGASASRCLAIHVQLPTPPSSPYVSVPAVLLAVRAANPGRRDDDVFSHFMLVCPTPPVFAFNRSSATAAGTPPPPPPSLRARLISFWAVSRREPAAASLLELWCATGATGAGSVGRRARVAAACAVRRRRSGADTQTDPPHTFSVVVFPALQRNPWTCKESRHRLPQCVWQCLVIATQGSASSCSGPIPTSAGKRRKEKLVTDNSGLRRQHFSLTRLLFGKLLRSFPETRSVRPNCFRRAAHSIGVEERATLLHLFGRGAFPEDYYRCQTVMRVARTGSHDRSSALAGSDTGFTFVMVRAAGQSHRLPPVRGDADYLLLTVRRATRERDGDMECAVCVSIAGTTTAPSFFSNRLGSDVVVLRASLGCLPSRVHPRSPPAGVSWVLAATPAFLGRLPRGARVRLTTTTKDLRVPLSSPLLAYVEEALCDPSVSTPVELLQQFV